MTRRTTEPNLRPEPSVSIAVDMLATVRDAAALEFLLSGSARRARVS